MMQFVTRSHALQLQVIEVMARERMTEERKKELALGGPNLGPRPVESQVLSPKPVRAKW